MSAMVLLIELDYTLPESRRWEHIAFPDDQKWREHVALPDNRKWREYVSRDGAHDMELPTALESALLSVFNDDSQSLT